MCSSTWIEKYSQKISSMLSSQSRYKINANSNMFFSVLYFDETHKLKIIRFFKICFLSQTDSVNRVRSTVERYVEVGLWSLPTKE